MTMDAYLKFSLETAMKRDGRENTIELSREVEDPKSIGDLFNSNYDDVTYKKGAAMVRMMEHFLTKKTLTQGLRTYLEAMAFKSVTPDDLWYHLNAQAERDGTLDPNLNVKTIMDTWTLQPGYPVIKVERDYEMRTATITQRRFFNSGIHKDMREKWWIPITWTTPNGDFENTHDVLWFKPDQDKTIIEGLPDDDTPIIVNIQVAGYYRVDYDRRNWKLLAKSLRASCDSVHHLNQIQMEKDAEALNGAGILDDFVADAITNAAENCSQSRK